MKSEKFEIKSGDIKVFPKKGEEIRTGEIITIKWDKLKIVSEKIIIRLSKDNGNTWIPIAKADNNGSYDYAIPDRYDSKDCLIEITRFIPALQNDVNWKV